MNINIAILEDNKCDYQDLLVLIEGWGKTSGNIISASWYKDAETLPISDIINSCDIFFADIALDSDNITGLDVCRKLRNAEYTKEIIFLTACREYVFEGYNVQAFNYLLKPIDKHQLEKCLNKYVNLHNTDYYYYRNNQDIFKIPYYQIISISKDHHNVILQTADDIYVERTTLNEIEKRLPEQFIRCHKSCIINIFHIYSLSGNVIRLTNNLVQPVGRTYLANIRSHLIEISTD